MKVVRGISEMLSLRRGMKGSVGLVPTMGYLHRGHMALVGKSQEFNASTIVSIFVNPTQFGPQEDFAKYPRDEQQDIKLLEQAGVDVLFIPSADEMYPDGFDSWVEVRGITDTLEGARRTGHFLGVATICNKLFNITAPHRAYFGQKDAQQVLVVRKMVCDLNMNLEIDVVPTVREEDGLAMSSRNTYLSTDERRAAAVLYKALLKAREMCAFGERDAKKITGDMTAILQPEPLV
ncbi:MAG: pantoate--beta-alanine ligase, partial [Dehalococcoidia bacterium]|nr:pantoate--beta-alanine ligase [Dehalococcoidia bacterium]